MAAHSGPEIVNDGLVLYLDGAEYSGTGTTWSDLSGNGNDGTLINGVAYSADNKGSLVFDGVNDYIYSNISSNSSSYSLSLVFKINSFTSTDMRICGAVSGSTAQFAAGWINTTFRIWVGGGWRNTGSSFSTGIYYFVDIVNASNSSTVYVNSEPSLVNLPAINYFLNLGFGSNFILTYGTYFNGNISNIQLYNRALTANEVSKNFEAMRGRYGI